MKRILFIIALLFTIAPQFCFSQNILENKYDVKEYILDLQLTNNSTLLSGNVTINSIVTAAALDTFVVDLIDTVVPGQTFMVVDSVFFNGVINPYQHHNNFVYIPLSTAIPQGLSFSIQIYYHGNGMAFSQTHGSGIITNTYCEKPHTYSMSQPVWSKVWWPCKQELTDKADSVKFYITTDSINKTGSNGLLQSTVYLPGGKVKYLWVNKYPIDFYLISFAVGPLDENITYAKLPNSQDSVLIQSLLFANSPYFPQHLVAINKTKQLIYLFSELFGTYPFKNEKYGYCVVGAYGGMEHQTMCTIRYDIFDTTFVYINGYNYWVTAHELAHQWFGDYVTCSKWNYIWLNEGFASYMEYVALQNMESQARADAWMQYTHLTVVSSPGGSVYIPDSVASIPDNVFDYRLQYRKGASILHLLRYEIDNDSLFYAVLKNYLSFYANSVASTDNFKQIAETTTGMNFTDFFDQWYYGEGYPIFNLRWSQVNDTVFINSIQTTSTSKTPLFKTHFDIKINYALGDTIITLYQGSNNETYKIYCPHNVTSIRFDPKYWLIQKNYINTGILERKCTDFIYIFPNPSNNKITIYIDGVLQKKILISFYNIQGKEVFSNSYNDQSSVDIDVSSLAKGVYMVKIQTEKGFAVKKLVIQ